MDDQGTNRESGGLERVALDICDDDDDDESRNRFRMVLRDMGAKLKSEDPWTLVGDIYEFVIGDETFNVVSDPWTTRVFASAELVARIQDAMKEKQKPTN